MERDIFHIKYNHEAKSYNHHSGQEFNFQAERIEKGDENYEQFENIFEEKESKVFITWEDDNSGQSDEKTKKKKIIEDFERYTKTKEHSFYLMWKSGIKGLFFKYGYGKDDYISKYLENKLRENPALIFKLCELTNKFSVKKAELLQLVKTVYTDQNFDIMKHEELEEKKDSPSNYNQFLQILIISTGDGGIKFNSNFNNFDDENKKAILQSYVRHYMKIKDYVHGFSKDLYCYSLDSKFDLIQYFKGGDDHLKNKFKKIKEEYVKTSGIEKPNEKIIDDLFATDLFSKCDIKTKQYYRFPLWIIVQLYFNHKEKTICLDYLWTIYHKKYILEEEKEKEFKSECSCLSPIKILFSHYHPKLADFFRMVKKDSFEFNFHESKIDEYFNEMDLQQLKPEIEIDDVKKKKNIIMKLVENKMKNQIQTIVSKYKSNEECYENLNLKVKEIFKDIVISLNNKRIFSFTGDNIEKAIEEDIFKNRILSPFIDNKDLTFSQMIFSIITEMKKSNFINSITIDDNLKLEILKSREQFLQNEYMEHILQKIVRLRCTNENVKKRSNIEILHEFYLNFEKIILSLNLIYKIQHFVKDKLKIDIKNDESNTIQENDRNNIIITGYLRILKQLTNYSRIINHKSCNEIIEYCIEFSMLNECFPEQWVELVSYYLVKRFNNNLNKVINNNHDGIKFILELQKKNFIPDKELFKEKEINKFVDKDKTKFFIIEILRVIFYHNKFTKPANSNTQQKELNNEIFKIISKEEYLFESIPLIQQMIEQIISGNKRIVLSDPIITNINEEEWESLKILKQKVEKVKMKNATMEKLAHTYRFLLLHWMEKILLKTISVRKIEFFSKEWFKQLFEESLALVSDYNSKLLKEEGEVSLEHYFAIAFLKLFAHVYVESLVENKENSSNLSYFSEYFSDHPQDGVKILEFYILKIIRNKYCISFRDFRNFNFSEIQMIWTSELKFRGSFDSEFEFLFFSDWNFYNKDEKAERDNFNFFTEYDQINKQIFDKLKSKSFRSSEFDNNILNYYKTNPDMYVDLIMNEILCHTWDFDYRERMEYIEFCSWSKHLLSQVNNINDKLKQFLSLLFISNTVTNNRGFQVIINCLKDYQDKNKNVFELEIILISLKFAMVYILVDSLNISPMEAPDSENKSLLITKMQNFIIDSIDFYKSPNNKKCSNLINNYKELQTLLRMNNICQIKLFMNFCYYLIKTSNPSDLLYNKIKNAIEYWPNQTPFIKEYYTFTQYNNEKIRNLLLDERFQPEALTNNLCGIKDKTSTNFPIPVFIFFFYETLPTWDTFTQEYKQQSEDIKQKCCYINFFIEPNNYELYEKELTSKTICKILSVKNKQRYSDKQFYNYKYHKFASLDDLAAFYSKSYIFNQKECNTNLGYKLTFDIESIEKELASIEFAVEKSAH